MPQEATGEGLGPGVLSYRQSHGVSGPGFRLFFTDLLEIGPGGF